MKKCFLIMSAMILQTMFVSAQNFAGTEWTDGFTNYKAEQKGSKIVFEGGTLHEGGYQFALTKKAEKQFTVVPYNSDFDYSSFGEIGSKVEYRVINDNNVKYEFLVALNSKNEIVDIIQKYDGELLDRVYDNFVTVLQGRYSDANGVEYYFNNYSLTINGKKQTFECVLNDYVSTNCIKLSDGKVYIIEMSTTGINLYNTKPIDDEFEYEKTTLYKKLSKKEQESSTKTGRWVYTQHSPVIGTTGYFSKDLLRIMRNEIYARHGYVFNSADLKEYFGKMSWYHPVSNNSSVKLSELETLNINIIKKSETSDWFPEIEKGL
ncbi:MAG: YARHG domain-containing protein [Bacteroidales bacterium]|nr:YARHG domain-containing protein [Bacteroidales bacterium]